MKSVKPMTDTLAAGGGFASSSGAHTPVSRWGPPAAVIVAVVAVSLAVSWADPSTPGGLISSCPSKLLFHIDCPGCGSLRMINSLAHGDVGAALRFNAVGVLGLIVLGYTYVRWTWGRVREVSIIPWHARRFAPHVVLCVVLVWAVVRNIPVAQFTGLYV